MGQTHFSRMPGISYPRSKYKMPFKHNTSFNHGQLVPIDCFPVIPGDTFSLKLSSLIRMSTPIAPIMDGITCHVQAFFVPMRLVWQSTEEFFGANSSSAGPQPTTYSIPHAFINNTHTTGASGEIFYNSLSAYLRKPVGNFNDTVKASVLKERGYYLIWNEWFRAQQVQNPVIITKSGNGSGSNGASIGTLNATRLTFSSFLLNVNKDFDYFTSATIQPQYGPSVTLPLGTYAPLVYTPASAQSTTPPDDLTPTVLSTGVTGSNLAVGGYTSTTSGQLRVDLSNATAATINSIRYAFAVQKYLERCNFGTRYFEILKAHYGVTSPDARLQRPELLGETRFEININQVTSVAGYSAGTSTTVGETGAISVTANKTSLFTKGFVEFGYVYVMLSTVQDQSYSQGLLREDFLFDRFDFYSPEFANLGDQEIKNKEIMVTGTNEEDTFGYQEHWAELRYRPNANTGLLNPAVGGLDFWTLGNNFPSRPSLNSTFLEESRDNITRCLKTGSSGPDYIASFYFDYTATREIPLYSIPGLVDHVGNM